MELGGDTRDKKNEGLSVLSQYLLTGIESCRRDFHGHVQLLHMRGALYIFVAGNRLANPGTNPACLKGRFSVWTGLQGAEDMGTVITTYNADLAILDGRNSQADHIIWAVCVLLLVIVGPLYIYRVVCTC